MSPWPAIDITDGTEQQDRFPRALASGYFQPDERRFEELLALGADIARILPFYDLSNKRNGTWGALFTVNEAAVMALILSKDTKKLESGFSERLEAGSVAAWPVVYGVARDVDNWLAWLSASKGRAGIELRERIEGVVRERLASELHALREVKDIFPEDANLSAEADFHRFHLVWRIEKASEGEVLSESGGKPVWYRLPVQNELRRIFSSFINVILYVQSLVRPYLDESLHSRTHDPALALFVVFVRLLEKTRKGLNDFTDRHLDFYYRRVLGATPMQHASDSLLFSLEVAEGQSEVRVPTGTELVTTADEGGGEIVFATEQDTQVTGAKVVALRALCFQRDPFISPESELGYVTRIASLQRDLDGGGDAVAGAPSTLPLFGPVSRTLAEEGVQDARIGFAVSSPILLMGEGRRIVEVEVELGDPGESSLLRNEVLRQAEGEKIGDSSRLVEIFARYWAVEADWLQAPASLDTRKEARRLAKNVSRQEIETAFEGSRTTGRNYVYDLFLKALVRQRVESAASFRRIFGLTFRRDVLAAGGFLDEELREKIRGHAERLLDADAIKAVERLLKQGRREVFQTLLDDVFEISLTVPSGWLRLGKYVMTPLEKGGEAALRGLKFHLVLGPEEDPIVSCSPKIHGAHWGGDSPLIRFRLNRQANFCVYSLLSTSRLSAVSIEVQVRGLRDLRLYNNVGRIDPSKPFQPFGSVPSLSSYFALGSYEMAQKHLSQLTVNLEWADLPSGFGGFTTHYDGYERVYSGDDFQVDLSVLQDGSWQPELDRQRVAVSLFEPAGPTEKLKSARSLDVAVLDFFRPADREIASEQFDLQLGVRNGFFRLGLSGPEGAFGHADYPLLLTKALSENIRSKVFKKVPDAPYTPTLSKVSVDYKAQARIHVDGAGTGVRSAGRQKIFHLHPFGYEEVRSARGGNADSLIPKYDTDGNLCIGIAGTNAGQTVGLAFQLAEESNRQTAFESPDLAWYYLSVRGWRRLPASSLILDTTNGLLCSGVVTLAIPDDADSRSTLMSAGKAWVRVGANSHLDSFPRLVTVRTNGVRAIRQVQTAVGETFAKHLPSGRAWRTAVSVAGLGAIVQLGASIGGAPTESRRLFLTRISDRLRHKGRAITARDYERLVLQRFPDLFKVKCFTGLCASETKPMPGHILMVVVPHADGDAGPHNRCPMVNVLELKKIRSFVEQVSSPFVEVEVRNPLYERIQVRCRVKLRDDSNAESYIRQLDGEVSDFLSPWSPGGYRARFGWMISREQVEDFIRRRSYVELVTKFSLLHITEDDPDTYTLADTVFRVSDTEQGMRGARSSEPVFRRRDRVRWHYPWSLAVPMERHFIEAQRVLRTVDPVPAGIGGLEIGSTLIINGTDQS